MVIKRRFEEDGESGSGDPAHNPNKRLLRDVGIPSVDVEKLEPFLRIWVREELERMLPKILEALLRSGLSTDPTTGTSNEALFALRFLNDLPSKLFTARNIMAENGSPLMIELIDLRTNTRVSVGPLSSAKLSILVLDGEFDFENMEGWSEANFESKILRAREGRPPLITGQLTVTLQAGLGYIANVSFTDNSKWVRSGQFRLGALVVQKGPGQVRVMEAVSRRIVVKDHRGEGYKKHYPPRRDDDVWRLNKIAKDGKFHSRLSKGGINTVEDFLRFLEIDPALLRTIISDPKIPIPKKTWEVIVEHAMTCVVDDNPVFVYSYEPTTARLFFNSVYRVVKVTFDGYTYLSVDDLSLHQMGLMQNLKRQAYANLNQLVPVHEPIPFGPPPPVIGPPIDPFLVPQEFPQVPFQEYSSMSESTLYGSEGIGSQQPEVCGPLKYQSDNIFSPSPAIPNNFMTGDFGSQDLDGGIGFHGSSQGAAMFHGGNVLPAQKTTWNPENSFPFGSSSNVAGPSIGVHIRGRNGGRSGVAWCKIKATIMFRSMRNVAARRKRLYAMQCSM